MEVNVQEATRRVRHRLTNIDPDERTAICSVCGPTRIRYRAHPNTSMCMSVRQAAWKRDKRRVSGGRREGWLRRYGVTEEKYTEMLAAQGGGCALCGVTRSTDGRALAIDHDHVTGRVRGILCGPCNMALGLLGDDAQQLERAASYLRRRAEDHAA